MVEEHRTIREEIEDIGINPDCFDKFYHQLNESRGLPVPSIVPRNQYSAIVAYLKEKQVLEDNNKINPDGMKIFDSRRELEKGLPEDTLSLDGFLDGVVEETGGFALCTYETG